jgi:hypothetical protein
MNTIIPDCGAVIVASLTVLLANTGNLNVVLAVRFVMDTLEESFVLVTEPSEGTNVVITPLPK